LRIGQVGPDQAHRSGFGDLGDADEAIVPQRWVEGHGVGGLDHDEHPLGARWTPAIR
jgi:hypothetical protein